MPAANHAPPRLRISSTGLAHGFGGGGLSTSSILKSPSAASATPVAAVLCCTNGAAASQISVASTLWLALRPMLLPPASKRPLPLTLMLPSVFTSALRSSIVQIWPGGLTPRTVLRATVTEPSALTVTFETGTTPIPPLNFARESSASDASGTTSPNDSTANFLNMSNPPGTYYVGWIV